MKSVPTLLRRAEHLALGRVSLSGSIIDLGGEKGAEYLKHIRGEFSVTSLNLDESAKPDIFHDLEQPLPLKDASFDHALLINVLEHIYGYRELLAETARVVRPGGTITIVVPFLFPVHPSPRDYWRFTERALRTELEKLGLDDVHVTPLGSGVFAARYVMLDRLLPYPIRLLGYYSVRYLASVLDTGFAAIARVLGKKYSTADYALGYLATGTRP